MTAHPVKVLRLLMIVGLLAGILAACGSDDAEDPTATTAAAAATDTTAESTATSAPDATATEPAEEATDTPATATVAEATSVSATATVAATATEASDPTAQSLPVTVTDVNGDEVTIEDTSRIVALTGDVAEIIWALGMGDSVVGTDISATYPEGAAALQNIGYQRTLAAEGILSLDPTVIIGSENAGPPEVLDQLRSAGVPVVIISSPPTLEAPALKIQQVADALGISVAGEELVATVQEEIDAAVALAQTATTQPSVLFLYVRGATTQMIGGVGSTADALIAAAGGVDAGTAAGIMGYQPLTAESLVTAAPDTLLLLDAGLASVGGVEGLLQIPGVAQTPAGENQNILVYEDLFLLGLGPRTGQMLHELTIALHPELGQ